LRRRHRRPVHRGGGTAPRGARQHPPPAGMTPAADPLQVPVTPPQQMRRRRIDGFDGRTTRDRLSTMLVLAALLHGLVLLGITFNAPGSRGETRRGLEVLLVSEELPEAADNDDATYLAQRSQEGSGNTSER